MPISASRLNCNASSQTVSKYTPIPGDAMTATPEKWKSCKLVGSEATGEGPRLGHTSCVHAGRMAEKALSLI